MTEAAKSPVDAVVKPKSQAKESAIALVLPALLAAASAFAAVRVARAPVVTPAAPAHVEPQQLYPPGLTTSLEPFLLGVTDDGRKIHPMKISLAIELKHGAKEDEIKPFVPRIRDSTLGMLRAMSFEEANDPAKVDKLRSDLLDRYQRLGAHAIERVLVTDLVIQ